MSAEEILDVVDAADRVVGRLPRAEVYARQLIHRCVFVLVRDPGGRIFVHRRTEDKLTYPGVYECSSAAWSAPARRTTGRRCGRPRRSWECPGWTVPRRCFASSTATTPTALVVGRVRAAPQRPGAPAGREIAWHDWVSPAELDRMRAELDWTPDSAEAYERVRPGPGDDRASVRPTGS